MASYPQDSTLCVGQTAFGHDRAFWIFEAVGTVLQLAALHRTLSCDICALFQQANLREHLVMNIHMSDHKQSANMQITYWVSTKKIRSRLQVLVCPPELCRNFHKFGNFATKQNQHFCMSASVCPSPICQTCFAWKRGSAFC